MVSAKMVFTMPSIIGAALLQRTLDRLFHSQPPDRQQAASADAKVNSESPEATYNRPELEHQTKKERSRELLWLQEIGQGEEDSFSGSSALIDFLKFQTKDRRFDRLP